MPRPRGLSKGFVKIFVTTDSTQFGIGRVRIIRSTKFAKVKILVIVTTEDDIVDGLRNLVIRDVGGLRWGPTREAAEGLNAGDAINIKHFIQVSNNFGLQVDSSLNFPIVDTLNGLADGTNRSNIAPVQIHLCYLDV